MPINGRGTDAGALKSKVKALNMQSDQGSKKRKHKEEQRYKRSGLRDRMWPISLRRLKEHNIPYTDLLKMPTSIWVSSVIINILGVGLPLLILQVYDRVIPHQSFGTLSVLVLGFLGLLFLEFLLRLARAYSLGWAATQFEVFAGQMAIRRLLNTPLDDVMEDKTQTQMDRLTAISRLADFFGGPNSLLIIDLPFVLILVVVMGLIAGPLVLVPVGVLMVFAVLTLQFGKNLKVHFEAREAQDNRTYDFVAECLRGVITLKGLSMEPFMLRRFERLQKSRASTNFGAIQASSSAQSISAILGNVTIIATVSIGAMYAVMGNLTIGTLAACTLLSGRIIQPVVRFAGLWTDFQKLELALQEASDLFHMPQRSVEGVVDMEEAPPVINLVNMRSSIGDDHDVGPVSMLIESGECLGITGSDSYAKTSFLKMVSGLSQPTGGQVLYNNLDVFQFRNGNPGSIVMVGPKSHVFDGTILENLSLFGTGPTVDEVRWASNMTGIEYDINCLPMGYDTPIGDGAIDKLPQGLVQRLLLTRSIAMLPKVLILDEPQMFLDHESDLKLLSCLSALRHNITIIISTMRPSYFHITDRLLRFDDGQIIQSSDSAVYTGTKPVAAAGGKG